MKHLYSFLILFFCFFPIFAEDETPYITFKAEAGQTFSLSKVVETLEYSLNNGEWSELGTNTITFGGDNGDLRLRGKSLTGTGTSEHYKDNPEVQFSQDILVYCSGDIRTLVDYENYDSVDCSNAGFKSLFYDCKCLATAPELPATTLASSCYEDMFYGCTSLTKAPELPATTLAIGCYRNMFGDCTSLTQAPELPATTLTIGCYSNMFCGCISLTQAPELPAITLANGCYQTMFQGCTSLTQAPELPATTLADYCYAGMFQECTSLIQAPELPVTTLAYDCYSSMFYGCTSLTRAPELPATTLKSWCYDNMFYGCTSLTQAPELPATTLAERCYNYMFEGCISLTQAPELPATTLADFCYNGMFRVCTSLTQTPELPATNLANACYYGMFEGCTSLTQAPELPATTLADFCYNGMLLGCTSLTQAPELPATTLVEGCYNQMFEGCISLTQAPELPASTITNYTYVWMFLRCTSLSYVKMLATDISDDISLDGWLEKVSPTGTFVKSENATWDEKGVVPTGWKVVTVLSISKEDAKSAIDDAAGDNPSDAVQELVTTAKTNVDVAESIEDVAEILEEAIEKIKQLIYNGSGIENQTELEAVDLGLTSGTLWANMNLGASSVADYGDYFAWGETSAKDNFGWDNYKWFNGSYYSLNKYCTDANQGTVDNLVELVADDDAAYNLLGSNWSIPTKNDFQELIDECSWEVTNIDGIAGYLVKSKVNENSIFIPFSGFKLDSELNSIESQGYYWTNSVDGSYDQYADYLSLTADNIEIKDYWRFYGYSIRPINIEKVAPAALSKAKEEAKSAIDDAAGDNPSDAVQELVTTAKSNIDAADNIEDVTNILEEAIEIIKQQINNEAGVETISGNITRMSVTENAITLHGLRANSNVRIVSVNSNIERYYKVPSNGILTIETIQFTAGAYIIETNSSVHKIMIR